MNSAARTAPAPATSVPPEVRAISKKEVVVTAAAAQEIAKQRGKRGTPNARIRVGVRGGGCTGFSYVFEWADEPKSTDSIFSARTADGAEVGIVVDPKSLVYLGGMTLDFVQSMMGHGFKFNNPNAKGSCGCGESVQF
ncbi:MAG: iron-sulfur cluster assembly accessory protein [Kofleriaceae bacterium]